MSKQDVLKRINKLGLLAVLRGPTSELTIKMVEALVAGGVTGIEITFTTPDAVQVVKELDRRYGDRILLGMGTLTDVSHATEACAAGAKFLVSPHCEPTLAAAMAATGLAFMVGALTPTEVERAFRMGSDVVKLFPGSLVGPEYLKSLRGPFPHIPMMPTGGVNIQNVGTWFSCGAFAVGAGSELCPTNWAKEGRFDAITQRAREFCIAVEQARPSR